LDLLLAAFLSGAPSQFKLVVAGPDECGLWDALAANLNPRSRERVVRVGTVAGAGKAALLAGASLFALPSEHENFGIAALEALAVGTPVLLSPHVDLADAVVAENLGPSVPLDLRLWKEQFALLRTNAEELSETGERSRSWVCE